MPSWFKKAVAVLGVIATGVITFAPSHTIAHQIALAIVGATAAGGVVSTGAAKPSGASSSVQVTGPKP